MATTNSKEIVIDFSPLFRLFTDKTIERFHPSQSIPTTDDPTATILTKDIIINTQTNVSVRIFLPRQNQNQTPSQKLPLVIYIHGGAFCVGSPSTPVFHNFVSTLVQKSNSIAISIDYRLAPESDILNTYEDAWGAYKWIVSHAPGQHGTDTWLNEFADFTRVFLGGESAGANIANDVAIRAGVERSEGVHVEGMFLMHPFFGGKEVDKLYKFLCPTSSGCDDDPRLFPAVHEEIGRMAGRRVIFFVAENDFLTRRARDYCEGLRKSAWSGEIDMFETKGEGHCFYLFDLNSEKALAIMDRLVEFLKRGNEMK